MKCPKCFRMESSIIDTRLSEYGYKHRRHRCKFCKHTFQTREYVTNEDPAEMEDRLKKTLISELSKIIGYMQL